MSPSLQTPSLHPLATHSWVIVVAAGSGARFGGNVPKQYLDLGGRRVLDHSLDTLAAWFGDRVVLVVHPERIADVEPASGRVVVGGATRSESVRAGLAVIPVEAQFVLVHDAARPLVDHAVLTDLFDAVVSGADGAIPGLAVVDTIKRVFDGSVVETIPRAELVAVQTPQIFVGATLRRVHQNGAEATDDAALVEAEGGRIAVVAGSARLRKVTTAEDLRYLEEVLAEDLSNDR